MKKFLCFIMSFVMLMSVMSIGVVAFANDSISVMNNNGVEYFKIEEDNISHAFKSALSYCRDNSSKENPHIITLPSGRFVLNEGTNLKFTDYTTIDMTAGTELIQYGVTGTNIFKNLVDETKGGYSQLTDVKVIGGTLAYEDNSASESCLIRLTHSKNIEFKDVVFMSNGVAHCVEVAACKNVMFDGCKFYGAENYKDSSGDTLQIDILDGDTHFKGMGPYDYTMNDNITVQNCLFKDLRRGVGTQSIFAGLYQNNIKILNNKFDNIREGAISASNYINSIIKGNVITNTGFGIKFIAMKSDAKLGDIVVPRVKGKFINNFNSVISDNNISVVPTSEMGDGCIPIQAYGNITTGKISTFPEGNYLVGGLTITNNTINTQGHGIRLFDTINSTVSSNTVVSTKKIENNGIYLAKGSNNNVIQSNTITGFKTGINIKESSLNNTVKYNKLNSIYGNGIFVYQKGSASVIQNNSLTNIDNNGIYVYDSGAAKDIVGNTINVAKNHGISVTDKSNVTNINSNTLSNVGVHGVFVRSATVSNVLSNKLNNVGGNGVVSETASNMNQISSNVLSNIALNGIRIKATKITDIKSNTVTNAKQNGIRLESKTSATNITSNKIVSSTMHGLNCDGTSNISNLKSNTFEKNKKYGVYFASGAKATVYNNTYTKNTSGNLYSAGKKGYKVGNVGVPSISVSKKSTTATIKWKKVSNASSYEIYRATSKNGKYSKVATVASSKTSYDNKKLSKKKTYYYKVRVVRTTNSVKSYSNYSSIKSIKI